ncbi:hypothetical protein ACFQQB_10970 [Nonomuraea rubra]|uniref:hypothetical protein n=1 Tax=Nonomuraea rubra TaxID=46180 RepID=UPI00361AC0CD
MRNSMLTLAFAAGIALASVPPANAATITAASSPSAAQTRPPAVTSRIAVHFDLAKGQMPENIALGPDGTAYVTFAAARQVAAISPAGATRILATLPAPADGGAATPVLGFALTTGIVRTGDGTLYFLYASGDAATTGLYRLSPGGSRGASPRCRPPGCPTAWPTTSRRRPSTSPTRCTAPSPPCP